MTSARTPQPTSSSRYRNLPGSPLLLVPAPLEPFIRLQQVFQPGTPSADPQRDVAAATATIQAMFSLRDVALADDEEQVSKTKTAFFIPWVGFLRGKGGVRLWRAKRLPADVCACV